MDAWGTGAQPECPREVKSLCLRFPLPGECELVIVADGREKVYELTPAQVKLLAVQAVDAITK